MLEVHALPLETVDSRKILVTSDLRGAWIISENFLEMFFQKDFSEE